MNRPTSFGTNAANATVELDCPWCAEPIGVSSAELDDELVCAGCGIRVSVTDPDPSPVRGALRRLAA